MVGSCVCRSEGGRAGGCPGEVVSEGARRLGVRREETAGARWSRASVRAAGAVGAEGDGGAGTDDDKEATSGDDGPVVREAASAECASAECACAGGESADIDVEVSGGSGSGPSLRDQSTTTPRATTEPTPSAENQGRVFGRGRRASSPRSRAASSAARS